MKKIRILLADDHGDMLTTVSRMLSDEFDVIGTVRDGQEILRETKRLQPDVLVADLSMPKMTGLEAVKLLKESNSAVKVVFLTVHEKVEYVRESFALGALGYVVKPRIASDLVEAIKAAVAGQNFVSPSIKI